MKKVKRILAMLMAMAMVLGMAVTASAAEGFDIPVYNVGDGATFRHAQLIEVDPTTETGWKFSSTEIANAYTGALSATATGTTTVEQMAIWKLIKSIPGQETVPGMPAGVTAATDGEIAAALRAVKNLSTGVVWYDAKTVTAPGVYYIDVEEEGYDYNPMAAYVSFQYNAGGVPTDVLTSACVQAKIEDSDVHKENNNGDAVTEIGREVTYTIKTIVPFIAYDNTSDYVITDTISGAAYKLTDNKMMVNVKVGESAAVPMEATLNTDKTSFSLNLNAYAKADGRGYAGQDLVITYTAIVTDMEVHNNVTTNSGDHSASTDNYLFAGTATLTKTDDAANEADRKPLANAQFVIKKGEQFATFTEIKDNNNNVTGYELSGWVDSKDTATKVTTGSDGKVTVMGLDNSEEYQFVEVVAPNGYSVNETPAEIIWDVTTKQVDETVGDVTTTYTKTIATGTASMADTALAALPATGGIGTYIFTIAGIIIMAAAAGFFFVSRRKANR